MAAINKVIADPLKVSSFLQMFHEVHELPWIHPSNSAYLPRAVSTVPIEQREFLNEQYDALIKIVSASGIEPKVPVELGLVGLNEINPKNDELQRTAKFVLPLTYAVSDGRGFEMGMAYALAKPTIPLLLRGQKINVPTLRRSFFIPIIFDDLTTEGNYSSLVDLLNEFQEYDFGIGTCSEHGKILAGFAGERVECMRCLASNYFDLAPHLV